MSTFTSPRTRSALTSHELSALGSLMHGGGTVAEFHVSLLTRVLRGAQAWHRAHPDTNSLSRREKKRLARVQHRVHRFVPVTQSSEPGEKILGMKDSRNLLDDYGLLAAATAAAQAYGPLKPGIAIRSIRDGIRPREHRVAPQWRSGSTVALAA
ncbi:hypothetical protein CKW39_10620 [Kocuria sp. WRN011]|uniref:Uncharacterized protein n=1 Tax=Kocuria carniphila TaxID=262208 RepID=A0ABV3UXJ2_9MICC|nr:MULTISPECIES: hypothetical protein [Kocuria]PBB08248.1 hypothetical protein CKW39_10620 [Kocuria sp. WRN011]